MIRSEMNDKQIKGTCERCMIRITCGVKRQIDIDNLYGGLKTNEDNNPNLKLIKKFGELIAESDFPQSLQIVSEYMNIDKIISYAVVDRAIRNDDGVFHWYEFGQGASSHNYYWYEESIKQKIHLIPWDLDNSFENISFSLLIDVY